MCFAHLFHMQERFQQMVHAQVLHALQWTSVRRMVCMMSQQIKNASQHDEQTCRHHRPGYEPLRTA